MGHPRIRVALWGALACLAALTAPACGDEPTRTRAVASLSAGERALWAPDRQWRYGVNWTTETQARAPAAGEAPVEGALALRGELVLRSGAASAEGMWLSAQLEEVSQVGLTLGGEALLPPLAQAKNLFEGHTLHARVGADGRFVFIGADPSVPDVCRRVVRGLLVALEVPAPASARGLGEPRIEGGVYGTVLGQYSVSPAEPGVVRRTRPRYERFEGLGGGGRAQAPRLLAEARFEFTPQGDLRSAVEDETTVLDGAGGEAAPLFRARSMLRVQLIDASSARHAAAPDPSRLEPVDEGIARADQARSVEDDQRFAEGLTAEEMGAWIVNVDRGLPLQRGGMVRMTTLVRSDDAAARFLLKVLADPELSRLGRGLLTDVLSSAGTAAAQQVLVSALQTLGKTLPDAEYAMLLQRMSLVAHPTRSSARFVAAEVERGRTEGRDWVRRAAVYTLGSISGKLLDDGETDLALAYERQLVSGLGKAQDQPSLEAYLAALGNIGRDRNLELILRHGSHTDAGVRGQVAVSLRHMTTDAARRALLELTGDVAPEVVWYAIDSLRARPLTTAEIALLEEVVVSDRFRPTGYSALRHLLGDQTEHAAARLRMLRHSLKHLVDGHERADTLLLIDALQAPPQPD